MVDLRSLYGLPPGVDFPAELVAGLQQRMVGTPPEAMARVTLFLNTQRMRRRIADILTASGARFLPRLRLVTEISSDLAETGLPAAISPLRRRLDLTVLLDRLLAREPGLFARTSLFNLADSLADLIDEMQGEGVSPARIAALDVSNHSAHWARTQLFLSIVAEALSAEAADAETLQRRAVEVLIARWAASPPDDPVIIAGSTGSRGTTALLMRAVAVLPNGAVVLPGFDFDLPARVWTTMTDALTAEDHPQFRFQRLVEALGAKAEAVRPWTTAKPPAPDRNQLISLSLRPAPVTDQWLTDGPALPDLGPATARMTLIEASSERAEAMSVALILRQAAEDGITAALISPDRNLTRRVAAILDRWGIRPDDSAGQPLTLSAPGRFLRHVASLFGQRMTADQLLTVLKHPLCFSGSGRGTHLRLTRELELDIRRSGPAFPDAGTLKAWAAKHGIAEGPSWAAIIGQALCGVETTSVRGLSGHLAEHRRVTEALARGFDPTGVGGLWDKAAGAEALAALAELDREADAGCPMSPVEYAALFTAVLQRREVRDAAQVHPGIMMWGTLEARVQGADLVILGGLNEGVWPAQPPADPWLNRPMRRDAGLLLPDRRIGLSAHDYQQAIAAKRVVLTRPVRNAEAETVPSRWLNRLTNLMQGLRARGGSDALAEMRRKGQGWLSLAAALEAGDPEPEPLTRPSPRPPIEARPNRLSLTQVERLIRDPYAIYARHVLRLQKLNPLRPEPDPRLRGETLHAILEEFLLRSQTEPATRPLLMAITHQVLEQRVAWPMARAVWRARIDRAADAFIAFSASTGGVPVLIEERGAVTLPDLGFTLIGKPDRIDLLPDSTVHLIDYKTGKPPSEEEQKAFAKQLLLAAAMVQHGAFDKLGPTQVSKISYVGIKDEVATVDTDLEPEDIAATWTGFRKLIERYSDRSQGYTSRRAVFETRSVGDYDHLARFGEWSLTEQPSPEDVG